MELLQIALPTTVSVTFSNAAFVYTVGYAAHTLDLVDFAGMSMGLTFSNMTANALGVGLSCGLDTLCSQEHGRDPDSKETGLFLQRSVIATVLLFLPLTLLYVFSQPLLAAVIQPDIAARAALWLQLSAAVSVPTVWCTCVQKYVQCHGVADIVLYSSLVGLATVVPLLRLTSHWGIPGFVVALALNRAIVLAAIVGFALRHPACRRTWGGWSRRSLDWGAMVDYLEVGGPSMVAFCTDLWGFEAMAIMAGRLGSVQVAVWTVVVNIYTIFWGPCMGICTAASVRVGNCLGAGLGKDARLAMQCSLGLSLATGLFCGCLTVAFGKVIVEALQADAAVVQQALSVIVLVAASLSLDVQFYVLQGLYRGCGKQTLAAGLVAIGHWCLGLPCSAFLSLYHHYDVRGILYGFVVGMLAVCPIFLFHLLWQFNWSEMARAISSVKRN